MRTSAVLVSSLALASGAAQGEHRYPRGYVRAPRHRMYDATVEVEQITDEHKTATPAAVDWSHATSAVKNQGECGSCWAFSTTEGIESSIFMATKQMLDLSTQQIISCDSVDGGCNGGDPATALKYIEKAGGLGTAKDYPDTSHRTGETGRCEWDEKKAARVQSWKYAVKPCSRGKCKHQDEDALAAAVAKFGPLSICLNAGPSFWDTYKGGVAHQKCSGKAADLDHCVQLVGFDKRGKEPYWKVRNSWGTSWGENGFIRLPYGKNACGLADEAYIITAELSSVNESSSVMV